MTNKASSAIRKTMSLEGGYNNIKDDKGGATNYGVSLRLLKSLNDDIDGNGIIDYLDIKNLTETQAMRIYYDNFWKPIYEKLPDLVAKKVFDISVNAGSNRAHILLQRALNALGSNIKADGLLGQITLNEIGKTTEQAIVNSICSLQLDFYNGLVAKDATQSKFLAGWSNRAKYLRKL